jgi:ATP-dependent Clp protease adapter protein ClpS
MSERFDQGTVVEKQAAETKPPPMFQVVLLNDDFTPMEFVVGILQKFFGKGREQATQIMLKCTMRAVAFAASIRAMWQPARSSRFAVFHASTSTRCSA